MSGGGGMGGRRVLRAACRMTCAPPFKNGFMLDVIDPIAVEGFMQSLAQPTRILFSFCSEVENLVPTRNSVPPIRLLWANRMTC